MARGRSRSRLTKACALLGAAIVVGSAGCPGSGGGGSSTETGGAAPTTAPAGSRGAGAQAEPGAKAPPAADHPQASAENLTAHYSRLALRYPQDVRSMVALFRGENEHQQRLIEINSRLLALLELEQELFTRFGECLDQSRTVAPLARDRGPAQLTMVSGPRATAESVSFKGSKTDLHLFRDTDGYWWISGYTYELDPLFPTDARDLDALDQMSRYMAATAPDVVKRLRAGEFSTLEEASAALAKAIGQRFPETRENPQIIFGGQARPTPPKDGAPR